MNEPIVIETTADASIANVWNALTNKDEMKKWYFDLEEFLPEVGFEFVFEGGNENKTFTHVCKILEVVPNKTLKHTWTYKGYEGVSIVTWTLAEHEGKTHITLTHEGTENFPASEPALATGNFVEGWTYIVQSSLKHYVQGETKSAFE